ncbi:N-6 DNA methylase [Archangium gephyra]|uniref:N-6 DNA methylase n=1 Tax=Archangium gephyra TaxID=48 RepID=UPI003B81293E
MPASTSRLSPQQRRTALEQLGRDRLITLTGHFRLEVGDKRVAANHVSALLQARSVDFSELLGLLKREELQSICEALGVDTGGREKEMLVRRILGGGEGGQEELPLAEAAPEEAPAEKPKAGRAKAQKNGGDLGFEATLWQAADKLRNNMDAAEYKHVVLGLIFLKYISDAFEERRAQLLAEVDQGADPEHPDEYRAENIFWVPREARWDHIQGQAKQPSIGKLIDDAMVAIERDNPSLKGVLPKEYARPGLDKQRLGELIDLIGTIGLGDRENRSKDILGRVYEYFLSEFASAEGKKGGQFYTPRSVVKLLVEMLAPYRGRVYDPCCGSGGMFIQSEKFVEAHGGKLGDISIFGQESNPTTWKLAKMNLAIRGIDANLGTENADSFHRDHHKDLKADYILANPPFNDSDWGGDRLREDVRWKYGVPPSGNANFAWVQHFIHHLAPTGTAGFVLANGSMSSDQGGEGEIRRAMVEADLVDCMVALPGQLFYSTQIPVCLWFLTRNKKNNQHRDRRGETLFIDARKLGRMLDRTQRELTDEDLQRVASTYHAWRGDKAANSYRDIPGFCKAALMDEIATHGFVLTPGRYVGAEMSEEDGEDFALKMARLTATLSAQFRESERVTIAIRKNLRGLGYGD